MAAGVLFKIHIQTVLVTFGFKYIEYGQTTDELKSVVFLKFVKSKRAMECNVTTTHDTSKAS